MLIGNNIRKWRKRAGLNQKELAKKLGVSFQAVSAWERDEYLPDANNLLKLPEILQVSMAKIMDQEDFQYHIYLFKMKEMEDHIVEIAKENGLSNVLKAMPFALMAHGGQKRKGLEPTDFIYHPLMLASHAIGLGLIDDEIIATCLLHDVVEDTKYGLDDLPVDESVKHLVYLLTEEKLEDRHESMVAYFKKMVGNEKAMIVKCIDRCHNLSDMAAGLVHYKQVRMIKESEEFVVPFVDELLNGSYKSAAYLLKYQICGLIETCKRLI